MTKKTNEPAATETAKPLPMPTEGGIYIRQPDGSLKLQEEPVEQVFEQPLPVEAPLKDD